MTSLETRLQDTENALYAALLALHAHSHDAPGPALLEPEILTSSALPRSKAERQNEWKHRPLRTSQDLLEWFDQQNPQFESSTSTQRYKAKARDVPTTQVHAEAPIPLSTPRLQEERSQPAAARSQIIPKVLMEQLRRCQPPVVPNTMVACHAATWCDNYF
jgi:hypothetical protein